MQDLNRILSHSSGLRAYAVRVGILKKPRVYFSKKHHLPTGALKIYEESSSIKSESTANRIYSIFLEEGLDISGEWFFEGDGKTPIDEKMFSTIFYETTDPESKTHTDILLFKSRYENADIVTIENEDNAPYYNFGDHVGFIWRKIERTEGLNKVACMLEGQNGDLILRICTKISHNKIRVESNKPEVKTMTVSKIAPIIFHRPAKRYRLIDFFGDELQL